MKINLALFLTLIVTTFILSCSESNKSKTDGESLNSEVATEGKETKPRKEKIYSLSQRLSTQFEELGISLSAEQVTQIETIAANYNFVNAADRPARSGMRQAFQKEVFEKVLTKDQQNAYNQSRSSRNKD